MPQMTKAVKISTATIQVPSGKYWKLLGCNATALDADAIVLVTINSIQHQYFLNKIDKTATQTYHAIGVAPEIYIPAGTQIQVLGDCVLFYEEYSGG